MMGVKQWNVYVNRVAQSSCEKLNMPSHQLIASSKVTDRQLNCKKQYTLFAFERL